MCQALQLRRLHPAWLFDSQELELFSHEVSAVEMSALAINGLANVRQMAHILAEHSSQATERVGEVLPHVLSVT